MVELEKRRFKSIRTHKSLQYWQGQLDALERASWLYRDGFYKEQPPVYTVYLITKNKRITVTTTDNLEDAEGVVSGYKQKYGGTVYYIEYSNGGDKE